MASKDVSVVVADKLAQIRGGHAIGVWYEKLKEANKAVLKTGKKASVAFILDIEPDKHDEHAVHFKPKLKISIPEAPFAPGIFYVNEMTGEPTREDPRQMELLAEQEAEREAERERQRAAGITHLNQVGRGNGTDG